MTMTWPVWVADLPEFRILRIDVDPGMDCADLTKEVRRTVPGRSDFVLYHFGLGKIVCPGTQSLAEYGMRGGDVLFLVPPTWPIGICRWLAEDVLDATLTTAPLRSPSADARSAQ
jgi:hypothetical protein